MSSLLSSFVMRIYLYLEIKTLIQLQKKINTLSFIINTRQYSHPLDLLQFIDLTLLYYVLFSHFMATFRRVMQSHFTFFIESGYKMAEVFILFHICMFGVNLSLFFVLNFVFFCCWGFFCELKSHFREYKYQPSQIKKSIYYIFILFYYDKDLNLPTSCSMKTKKKHKTKNFSLWIFHLFCFMIFLHSFSFYDYCFLTFPNNKTNIIWLQ